jgi:hypothetical protein
MATVVETVYKLLGSCVYRCCTQFDFANDKLTN